jgi:cytochrome c nitrite reductase small subunit
VRLQPFLATLASIAVGVAIGISGFTFVYAKGESYLRDNPEACANCHVMQEQFDGWLRSSHRNVAACNDCHTPKPIAGKYLNKFVNGLRHSWGFTVDRFHEPITIKPHNRAITESRCRGCHQEIIHAIDTEHRQGQDLNCIGCHGSVGHPQWMVAR